MINVVSVENSCLSESIAIDAGISSIELMNRAASGIYEVVGKWAPDTCIVCGSGNNGGDGFALAHILKQNKNNPIVIEMCVPTSPQSLHYRELCVSDGVKILKYSDEIDFFDFSIIVDALFGTGFKGQPKNSFKYVIGKINHARRPACKVISIDINSGLNADTGLGQIVIKSDLTIAIGNFKTGHFLNRAKDYIDSLTCIDIGLVNNNKTLYLAEARDFKPLFPWRKNYSSKHNYGRSVIIGGSVNYSGAAKLANLSLSALRTGVGIAQLAVPSAIKDAVLPYLLESVLCPIPSDENGFMLCDYALLDNLISNATAIAVGIGLGTTDETCKIVSHLIMNYRGTLIIDADGLNALATIGTTLLLDAKCKIILTPHIKEFSRLTGKSLESISQNPIPFVTDFASQHHVTLLLKGPTSIIAGDAGLILVDRGCPGMATGGSGDVLTGLLTGIVAVNNVSTLLATAAAAYIAGCAGEAAATATNEYSSLPSDAITFIPEIINMIMSTPRN
ncbi:MAG: NAD(P)H-hydrate dehydratase [Christensenellaceae bacterium]|jgi:NAD(P)H-hydrate epimerase|nr:NAD(P)H-hydrate dehydratase [Christensenellaceae bacterium]